MPTNTEFPKSNMRLDPYRDFRFRLKWDGKYVAGLSRVSPLTRSTQVVAHRSGGDPSTPRRTPGQSEYAAITLERGVTHDVAFAQWANKVWDYHNSTIDDQQGGTGNQDVSLKDFRKDIVLEVYNEAGQKVIAYKVYRCWPSEFVGLPAMDGNGSAVAIERLKLENEGWERDSSVAEPAEPSFTLPASWEGRSSALHACGPALMLTSEIPGGVVHGLPADLEAALRPHPEALATWDSITPLARNEWICWIESAKKPETRRKRIEWGCSSLKDGKRRPCCWPGCPHRGKRQG